MTDFTTTKGYFWTSLQAISEGQYSHLGTTSFPHQQLNSFPQVPAFRELAKLGHSEWCNSTFLLVEAKPSYHFLNSTIWGNYTWPAWFCTQSTCESTPLFQFKPPLGTLALFRFQNRLLSTSPLRRGSLQDSSSLAIIQVSTQLQLPPLYPCSFPCLLTIREPGWPSENI